MGGSYSPADQLRAARSRRLPNITGYIPERVLATVLGEPQKTNFQQHSKPHELATRLHDGLSHDFGTGQRLGAGAGRCGEEFLHAGHTHSRIEITGPIEIRGETE